MTSKRAIRFECDEHLKHVLCSLADLHRAAAGSQQTSNKVEEFFNKTNIRVLFTPDSSYFKNTSLYSQKSSTSVKPLKRSRLFSGVDLERRKQLLVSLVSRGRCNGLMMISENYRRARATARRMQNRNRNTGFAREDNARAAEQFKARA